MDLHQIGEDFFIPFFEQLWIFLDTEFLFGLRFRTILLGSFIIGVSAKLLYVVFGIGRMGGIDAYRSYRDSHSRKQVRGFRNE